MKFQMNKEVRNYIFFFTIASPFIGYALWLAKPLTMMDWGNVFFYSGRMPLTPYANQGFMNPPWVAPLLTPLALLPMDVGRIANALLNCFLAGLVVLKNKGNKAALAVTWTSLPFFLLLGTGNIEWIPMLGLIINWPILMLAKPQSGVLIIFVWFKQARNKIRYVLSILVMIGLSFLIWGNWIQDLISNIRHQDYIVQSSAHPSVLWPWTVPFGLLLLLYAWKKSDGLLAIVSTWLCMPYLSYHSMVTGLALMAARKPVIGLVVSILLYVIFFFRLKYQL